MMQLNQALNLSLAKRVHLALKQDEIALVTSNNKRVIPVVRLSQPQQALRQQGILWPVFILIAGLHLVLLALLLQRALVVPVPETPPITVSIISLPGKQPQTEVLTRPKNVQPVSVPVPSFHQQHEVKHVDDVGTVANLPVVNKTVETSAEQPRYEATTQAPPLVKPAEPVSVVMPPVPAKTVEKEEAIEPPKFGVAYLNNPAPEYPRLSKRAGEEGRVLMKVLVTVDGLPASVEVAKSSGFERLDAAAVSAVKQWRFEPARKVGKAISASVLVPLSFSLNE